MIIRPPLMPALLPVFAGEIAQSVAAVARMTMDFVSGLGGGLAALRTTRSGPATCVGPDGTMQWGPHNLYAESSTLVTQSVTVPAGSHIVSFSGAGSVVLSGAATGTISGTGAANRVFLLVSTTAGTLTSTVTGSVTSAQLENVTGTTRTTPSDYVDSTVKNRLLGYSNDFTNAAWVKTNISPQANSCTGPSGQPAHTLTAGAASAWMYQSAALAGAVSSGFLVRRRLGSGAVNILNSDNSAWIPAALTTDWSLVQQASSTATTAYCGIRIATAGDQIDICDARLVPGTSAANYFYNPAAAPTPGPVYGLRTDYDPVTLACKGALIEAQSTNLLLNSAVPATQNITTTAQAYTVSMWGTGTCTLSGTATGILTGTAANVRSSLTVTATAGTLTATFAGSNTNGQVEAGSLTSYIPTGAAQVTRTADTSQINFDDLAKALPWVMDTNIIPAARVEDLSVWSKLVAGTGVAPVLTLNDTTYAAPDGTFTADKVVFNAGAGVTSGDESSIALAGLTTTTGAPYTGHFRIMGSAGTTVIFRHVAGSAYQTVVCSGLGIWDTVPGKVEAASSASSGMSIGIRQNVPAILNSTATVWIWGVKINPGPIAQTYYPVSSKQGTILFEGDMSFGSASGGMSAFALENGASNRVEAYKGATSSNLLGLVNANSGAAGVTVSGVPFKVAIGFSPASAGVSMNGNAESPITPTAFAANPNVLKIGNDAVGSVASSMHLRRLRIFGQNLPASTKQALTRLP